MSPNKRMSQFEITPSAAERIACLIDEMQKESGSLLTHLRICVSSGGCSGFKYEFTLVEVETIGEEELEFKLEVNGKESKVVIDTLSFSLVSGSFLDYVDELAASSFVLKNPNATVSCGCGNSFSV